MERDPQGRATRPNDRWRQLVLGIVCMIMVANLQYGWTLFVGPIDEKFQWGRAAIQIAFTIFVLAETWLMPLEGYLADRFGPRPVPGELVNLPRIALAVQSCGDWRR